MAPEVIADNRHSEKADIFAAGVILFIMLAGVPPFQNAVSTDWWFLKLTQSKFGLFWMAHERFCSFSREAKDLLEGMMAPSVAARLDVNQVKQTAFFNAQHLTLPEIKRELLDRKAEADRNNQKAKEVGVKVLTESRDTLVASACTNGGASAV